MADSSDVLQAFWKEQRESARQADIQRATLTNIILLLASAGIGIVAQQGLQPAMLVVTLPMFVLGLCGAAASLKFHERAAFHMLHARWLREKIDELHPELELEHGLERLKREHRARFRLLENPWLWTVWLALHASITVAGAFLTLLIIVG